VWVFVSLVKNYMDFGDVIFIVPLTLTLSPQGRGDKSILNLNPTLNLNPLNKPGGAW
jgi:hypothetical protein